MRSPTTALDALWEEAKGDLWFGHTHWPSWEAKFDRHRAAIESEAHAQAVAQERARLRSAVEGLPYQTRFTNDGDEYVMEKYVLRLLADPDHA